MGERTGIAWCDSTRNFWSGCTKIGPGCDGCYAEAFNRWTRGKNEETGEAKNWGPGAPRVDHLKGAEKDLRSWQSQAGAMGKRRSVFINTFSDTFDNEVPQAWRDAMWPVLEQCGMLDFYLVTKRVGNVAKMVPEHWRLNSFPTNVRLLITIVNQEEADRDVPKLLALPCKNGISYEPALGPVDWSRWLHDQVCCGNAQQVGGAFDSEPDWECCGDPVPGLQWIIVGGESSQPGHPPRQFDLAWARSTITQCKAAGVAVFVKQLGSYPFSNHEHESFQDPAGEDPTEWPEDLHVREYPVGQ